jgi:predicted RNA-binding protein
MMRSFIVCVFNKYYKGDQIKEDKIYVVCMGKMTNAYKIFVGKLKRKRPLWRPRS